jgi:hypothetical protein
MEKFMKPEQFKSHRRQWENIKPIEKIKDSDKAYNRKKQNQKIKQEIKNMKESNFKNLMNKLSAKEELEDEENFNPYEDEEGGVVEQTDDLLDDESGKRKRSKNNIEEEEESLPEEVKEEEISVNNVEEDLDEFLEDQEKVKVKDTSEINDNNLPINSNKPLSLEGVEYSGNLLKDLRETGYNPLKTILQEVSLSIKKVSEAQEIAKGIFDQLEEKYKDEQWGKELIKNNEFLSFEEKLRFYADQMLKEKNPEKLSKSFGLEGEEFEKGVKEDIENEEDDLSEYDDEELEEEDDDLSEEEKKERKKNKEYTRKYEFPSVEDLITVAKLIPVTEKDKKPSEEIITKIEDILNGFFDLRKQLIQESKKYKVEEKKQSVLDKYQKQLDNDIKMIKDEIETQKQAEYILGYLKSENSKLQKVADKDALEMLNKVFKKYDREQAKKYKQKIKEKPEEIESEKPKPISDPAREERLKLLQEKYEQEEKAKREEEAKRSKELWG